MGYDMYLIKADKKKLNTTDGNIYYNDLEKATICEVNSFRPVLRDFYQSRDDLHWIYLEYNEISENTLAEIIQWLKCKIDLEAYGLDIWEEKMTKMVYDNIKDWIPLKKNEVVYFEEDS